MRNSFQELEEDQIRKYGAPPNRIASNINHGMRTFRFIGDLFELFFPKLIKMFVNMAGGSQDVEPRKDQKGVPPNLKSN